MKLMLPLLLSASLFAQDPVKTEKPAPAPAPKTEQKQEPAPGSKPVSDKPKSDKPVSDKPQSDKPVSDKPVSDKPQSDKPVSDKPVTDKPQSDKPVPKGTDPADLAAMRGQEAMLEAERKLAEQIKSGKITGLDKILPFDELTSWPYEDGLKGMPKRVRDLSGKKVLMTGFMLPIDEVQNIKEFLLVQSLWSCCYGQPPDIHGIVRVVMPKGKTTDYFFDPLKIIGTFKVEATVMDGYCVDIFQLHVESIEVIK
ncbi:MAG: DUF3299 domain-containing protein [Planctomycetes bacterium]|nr:DUF3299 domain-containing protein [Planctomycetota bacterium]